MNPRRILIALFAALLLSGAVTFFLSRKISRRMAAAPAVTTLKYVAPIQPLPAGEVLKPENLTLVDWPDKLPLDGPFTRMEEVAGRILVNPVAARQPVLGRYLAMPGSGMGLAANIPPGMRATSVRSDEVVGVAGFLLPGSHVDVLVTFRGEGASTSATQIVLQDVEVLTIDQKVSPEPGAKAEKAGVVTLLLAPEEAQRLVLAATQGSIHFVLRNGADHARSAAIPVLVTQILGAPRVPGSAAGHARVEAKHPYEVETIVGDKHATSQFE